MRTRIGHGDFIDLIWVEPDLATATLEDARGEPLLELERNHVSLSLSLWISLFFSFFVVWLLLMAERMRVWEREAFI